MIMHFLPEDNGAQVVAALLVFRVIYYWVPLLLASVMLGYHEFKLAGDTVDGGEQRE